MAETDWAYSRIEEINSLLDESQPIETRSSRLLEWLPSLSSQIVYADKTEREAGQSLHLKLWRALLNKDTSFDIDSEGDTVVNQGFLDLIQLKEFEFTENEIFKAKFESNDHPTFINTILQYRECCWKTACIAFEILDASYISFESKKFCSKLLGLLVPMFPDLEDLIMYTIYSFSPPLLKDKLRNYPKYKKLPELYDNIKRPYNESFYLQAFPNYMKVRYNIDIVYNKIEADLSYTFRRKRFLENANIYGWKSVSEDKFEIPTKANLLTYMVSKDSYLIFAIVANYIKRLQSLYGNELIPLEFVDNFYICYRCIMPYIQAVLTTRYDTIGDRIKSLPSDWYESCMECSHSFLLFPPTINFFLRFLFQPCNAYKFNDTAFMMSTIKQWFQTFREMSHSDLYESSIFNPFIFYQTLLEPEKEFKFKIVGNNSHCFTENKLVQWVKQLKLTNDSEEAAVCCKIFLKSKYVLYDEDEECYFIPEESANFFTIIPEIDHTHCLPSLFDYKYFSDVLVVLINIDNHQILLTLLTLIYDYFDVFQGEGRLQFILDCVINRLFNPLFFHWTHEVRVCYFSILLYKVYQGSRARLPSKLPNQILERAHLDPRPKYKPLGESIPVSKKFSNFVGLMIRAMKSKSLTDGVPLDGLTTQLRAYDIVILRAVEAKVDEVCDMIVDKTKLRKLPPIQQKYAIDSLYEYITAVEEYDKKAHEDGIDHIRSPTYSFNFTSSKTLFD